jgi:hypothetical protein
MDGVRDCAARIHLYLPKTEASSRFPALDHVPFQDVVACSDAKSF